ncbi:hypothetical protein C5167_038141 [Papaver somniferum]|uniref:Uncharacterized protein n=1 Tax=Papaver somniferum TaxID=3469 RepID=A0A4Y7IAX9_PAPSO|nr:hypothetical protein C5167_038141 [Papaver somniferum]
MISFLNPNFGFQISIFLDDYDDDGGGGGGKLCSNDDGGGGDSGGGRGYRIYVLLVDDGGVPYTYWYFKLLVKRSNSRLVWCYGGLCWMVSMNSGGWWILLVVGALSMCGGGVVACVVSGKTNRKLIKLRSSGKIWIVVGSNETGMFTNEESETQVHDELAGDIGSKFVFPPQYSYPRLVHRISRHSFGSYEYKTTISFT